MELAFLVYVVENLTYNGVFFWGLIGFITFITAALGLISFLVAVTETDFDVEIHRWKTYFPTKTVLWVVGISLMLHVLLPTRQTAIYMAGAYVLQEVVTSEKAKEVGDLTYKATLRQLEKWSEEVPELKEIAEEVIEANK